MEFPLAVLQGLKLKKAEEKLDIQLDSSSNWNPHQYNKDEHCPIGCDPTRTTLAISKSGRKDKGNFVQVYYRGSGKLQKEVPIEVKQAAFWREFNELEERSNARNRIRPQSVGRPNQGDPGDVFR